MLNSRQRAQLRGLANSLDAIFQVGKGGLNEQLYKQVSEALEARELIKLRVLETSPVTSREAADAIAKETGASTATISRVNRSLNYGNEGFDMVLNRINK